MPLVFGVHYLNRIPSLRWLTRALSLSIITIFADKSSSRDQAYIKKWEDPGKKTDLHQNKKKSRPINPTRKRRVGWRQVNNFLRPASTTRFVVAGYTAEQWLQRFYGRSIHSNVLLFKHCCCTIHPKDFSVIYAKLFSFVPMTVHPELFCYLR